MSVLNILVYPDSRLRRVAKPVEVFDEKLEKFVNDMTQTMYAEDGIGLAAIQVNANKRVITIDISEDQSNPLVLINPEIIEKDGQQIFNEGCLSVPEYYAEVSRAKTVKVRARKTNGESFELDADGLLAVCIQHEIDHLDGKVFVDYLSVAKRERVKKKMLKRKN